MLSPIAASAKKMASGPNAACPPLRKIPPQSMALPDPLRATEDALGADEENEDQHSERSYVLQLGRHPHRRHVHEEPDDEAAEQCAVGSAEPAERDGGEEEQEQPRALLEVDVLADGEQDATDGGEAGAEHPHLADDGVDVDA